MERHGNPHAKSLDLIAIGRASVDLYGEQSGGRLEDMASFAKYVGGSPTNTVIGGSRLGLRTGLVTRVGEDHMGRFIREQLAREGVDTGGVTDDPDRLTALAILGIRSRESFPLLFYRENCADMALCADDIDPARIVSAGALLINGTHLSRPDIFAASMKAVEAMKSSGGKVIFDIDYRPVLWGLAAKENGEDRFVADAEVTKQLQRVLPLCDLVVGTEEEFHILGGKTETLAALREVRERSKALLVCKRGAGGCAAFLEEIGHNWSDAIIGAGFPVDVFNVLGAGDAFMAGFLRGWLRGESIERCCTLANACGAIVVSRHGCAPAMPTWQELQLFLSRSDWPRRLRTAAHLEQIHWSTNRHPRRIADLTVLAIDHRAQLTDLAERLGVVDLGRIERFKGFALDAIRALEPSSSHLGILADDTYGMGVLETAADTPYWIGRPIELPGSCPIEFEGGADVAVTLRDWPVDHVVKCLVFYHPDDVPELREHQDRQIRRLFDACRATRHELLLEVIASKSGAVNASTVSGVIEHIYSLGVYPDWWKLEPAADAQAWVNIQAAIEEHDQHCRGVLLLGLSVPRDALLASFIAAADASVVKGFAVGRTIWQEPAEKWLAGEIDDAGAVSMLTENFGTLVDAWSNARARRAAA